MARPEEEIEKEKALLVAYKQSGDLQLLGDLFKPYMPLVYGLCLKYLKDPQESQDAVMQIFEQLIPKVKAHQIENFKSWLYVLSKNHCLMYLRSQKHKRNQQHLEIGSTGVENMALMHHNDESFDEENISRLEQCIEELQKEQKACIRLFYLQKKSYKEVEEITKYDLKKVKSYIQNGKRNLKTCMERESE
ncbi:sigma-70 family RNA polymerase sigma factor [Fulvivirga sp. RKSG066]|uniref:RNA polymerase sigma factor n=1 Tax=Fulvivirga aurantia TaxID=2529383 RepID=UPI0012BC8E95|nr:sigma-70 family RNA polymerase sigma factor [Fulvivirga aurantia]MTI23189.1 sigma-70 family RNA polymerase sigma factor [Fulvivirga aurantia]